MMQRQTAILLPLRFFNIEMNADAYTIHSMHIKEHTVLAI